MSLLANPFRNRVLHGGCIEVMRRMEARSVDFILTDPPYLVNYHSSTGQTVANDNDDAWLKPAFAEMYRVLKDDTLCLSFYGWNKVDLFMSAWRAAGFRVIGHVVFCKVTRRRHAISRASASRRTCWPRGTLRCRSRRCPIRSIGLTRVTANISGASRIQFREGG